MKPLIIKEKWGEIEIAKSANCQNRPGDLLPFQLEPGFVLFEKAAELF